MCKNAPSVVLFLFHIFFKVILRLIVYLYPHGGKSKRLNKEISRKVNIYCIIGMILVMFFLLKIILGNKIISIEEYQEVMKSFGIIGPIVLTVFQALQVVIPILPGYLGCAAGAIHSRDYIIVKISCH